MSAARRLVSSLLLGSGIVLVFAGINTALGFSAAGIVASLVVIAGLLYAGSVWGAAPVMPSGAVLTFDHGLRLADGRPLLSRFPSAQHDEIRAKAIATLAGARASLVIDGKPFSMSPIVSDSGAVLYGAIVETSAAAQLR